MLLYRKDMKKLSEQLIIRNYTPSDYSSLKSVLEDAGLFYADTDGKDRYDEKIRRNPTSVLLGLLNNEIIGVITLMEDGWGPFFFRLAVKKDYRNKGIATKLLSVAEKEMKKRTFKQVYILVEDTNEELKTFYRKRGFNDGSSFLFMWKNLSEESDDN
jgi:ribosomal protein S18 acetylase RimI-like enzyme